MNMQAVNLFPGEVVLLSKGANALLPAGKNVSGGFLARKVPALIGPADHDYVGGRLHLTNYRLKFKSHAVGQPVQFTIFLPTIDAVADVSRLVLRKLRVVFPAAKYIEFVMWGIPAFIAALDAARERAKELDWDKIAIDIKNEADKIGDWAVSVS
jgi:hypothetical protein